VAFSTSSLSKIVQNQHIVGKLSPIPIGILEFDETFRFGKRRTKATTYNIFRLIEAKILYLHQVEGHTIE
jgi:hypothetical protein